MPRILTVSEVRKEIYLAAGGREAVGPGETSTALLGSLFHETFRLLTGPNPAANLCRPLERADRDPASWESQLIEHAYLWCVGPQMVKHKADLQRPTSEVVNYWKAVENLCRWLCEVLFKQSQPAQAIEELRRFIFADHELEVQAELADPGWEDTVILQGRMDAVLRQPSTGRLCAVELKLGQTSPEADLSQACLYHLLFSKMDPTMGAKDLALWSFQPEAHERVWKAAELDEAQAHLKDLVGKIAQVKDHRPLISPPPRPGKEVEEMARRILTGFGEFGTPIQLEGQALLGPTFYRFLARPARRVKADKILNMATTIWPRLGTDQPPQIAIEHGLITIDVQRPDRQVVFWNARLTQGVSRFPVGVDVEGNWKYADLAEPEHSHFLVAGTTGSGKTEWLKMVVGSLCVANAPKTLALILIDPKRTAFSSLMGSPYLHRPIVYPADENILYILDQLIQEMEERFNKFERIKVNDAREYNAVQPEPLPRIVCMCDEYADLILPDSKTGKEVDTARRQRGSPAGVGPHLLGRTPGRLGLRPTQQHADAAS